MIPLQLGTPADFAQVNAICQRAEFTEDQICQALNLEGLADLTKVGSHQRKQIEAEAGPLGVLIRLFLLGMSVPQDQVELAVASGADLSLLQRLDLVRSTCGDGEDHTCLATVCLYPVAGLLITSDRIFNPDGTHYAPPSDLVFAAISPGTLQFLRVISRTPVSSALDLCTGSGVAALLLSKTVERVTAVDITPRSVHFARFNALLNHCANVDVVQGDLYQDLGERRFDRIVVHPPYAPALANNQVWRDGGQSGEAVLQSIIEGLPDRLLAGGSFYAVTMGLDVGTVGFEDRVRQWMGQSQSQYDLVFAVDRDWTPRQLAADLAVRSSHGESALIHRWEEHLSHLGVSRAAYGALVIHRHESDGKPLTLRTRLSQATNGDAFDQAFQGHRWLLSPDAGRVMGSTAPRLSPHLKVSVTHGVLDGALVPLEFRLETDWPFRSTIRLEPWLISTLAQCDGYLCTADLFREAQTRGDIPDSFGLSDFAGLIALLVFKGCLEAGIR